MKVSLSSQSLFALPLAQAIATTAEIGYDGYLPVECLGPDAQAQPADTARRDLTILKRYLENAP